MSKFSLRQLGGDSTADPMAVQPKCQPPEGFNSFESFLTSKAGELDSKSVDPDNILRRDGIPYKEKVEKQILDWTLQLLNDVKPILSAHGRKMDEHLDAAK